MYAYHHSMQPKRQTRSDPQSVHVLLCVILLVLVFTNNKSRLRSIPLFSPLFLVFISHTLVFISHTLVFSSHTLLLLPPTHLVHHLVGCSSVGVEHRTVTPLTQVRFPGAARDFLPRVNSLCRLFRCPYTPVCNRMY